MLPVKRPAHFWSTLGFLYAVCVIEGADLQLLPATFRALERSLGLSPTQLATLGFAQAITQCTSGPFWASLADHGWSRKGLLVSGSLSWGVLTMLLAGVTNFPTMVVLRALNGAALGTLMPISQSVICDMTEPHERGGFFGWVQFFIHLGLVTCAVLAASISNETIHGHDGWRVAFLVVAIASFALALAMALFMVDPIQTRPPGELSFNVVRRKFEKYMRIPTFRVILLQGAFGSIPWSAMSFMILYYQYIGISDFHAATIFAAMIVGGAGGGILGGYLGDRMTRWNRIHGRPLTAQISVASGIPIIFVVLVMVPCEPASYRTYVFLMFLLGLLASWCAVGVNRPILAEVVGYADRASVLAWLVAIDGAFAALLGAPLVGLLAEEVFGYHPSKQLVANMPEEQRKQNAAALATAMLYLTVVPWIVCFVFYTFLHLTYGPDVASAADESDGVKDGKLKPTETSALI